MGSSPVYSREHAIQVKYAKEIKNVYAKFFIFFTQAIIMCHQHLKMFFNFFHSNTHLTSLS